MNAQFFKLIVDGIAFAALGLCLSCSGSGTQAPSKRLILLTCDTLRADRLGAYGYDRPVSPNLDQFAGESLLFERAYSSAASTVPAISSLLSGRLPDEIGVSGGNQTLMQPSFVTLAEMASEAGLATGAIVSNWVLRRQPGRSDAGVSQGFGHYDDQMDQMEGVRAVPERRGESTTLAASKWLQDRHRLGEDNFFLWVHYQDPHGPYDPPQADLKLMQRSPDGLDPEEVRSIKLGTNTSGKRQIPDYQTIDGEARPFFYRDRYDAEIRAFDRALGGLLDELRSLGWFENSLIIFTADHGESLGENDYWFCHGQSLSDEVVRVPLIVRFPGQGALQQNRKTAIASHLDVFPTVREFLGFEQVKVSGLSLASDFSEPRTLFQNCGLDGTRRRHIALIQGEHRIVIPAGSEEPQLFDLSTNASALTNIAGEHPEKTRELREALEAAQANLTTPLAIINREASERDEEMLRSLGYTGD